MTSFATRLVLVAGTAFGSASVAAQAQETLSSQSPFNCSALNYNTTSYGHPWDREITLSKTMSSIGCLLLQRDNGQSTAASEEQLKNAVKYMQAWHQLLAANTTIELLENGDPDGVIGPNFAADHIEVMSQNGIDVAFENYYGTSLYDRSMNRFVKELRRFENENYENTRAYIGTIRKIERAQDRKNSMDCTSPENERLRICGDFRAEFLPESRPSSTTVVISFKPV